MNSARDVLRRLAGADRRTVLAWLCLASLAVRSEDYPVLVTIGSAEVRAQDVLFGLLIVVSLPLGVAWARAHRLIAAAGGVFCLLVAVAALRSPVGAPAIVAVGKLLEFVLAGAAIALTIRRLANPSGFTLALVAATALNLAVAIVQAVSDGGVLGPLTVRAGGLLALESAAALSIVTIIWCLGRLADARGHERRAVVVGVGAALLLLLASKSVLAAAALLALAVISKRVVPKAAYVGATVGVGLVLVLIVTVGRTSDVRSAIVGSDVPSIGLVSVAPGPPPHVPPRYLVRKPRRVVGGSFVHRVALGYVGARIAIDSPFIGRGWQSTSSRDFLQDGPYDSYMVDRVPDLDPQLFVSSLPNGPHNAYIQLVAEAGWAAALALVLALLAAFVSAVTAIRRTADESWCTVVGAAWLVLVAIFLLSSSLFGGQLEASILGAAIVLGTPAASLAAVGARTWAVAAAALTATVAVVAAGLFLPASDARGQAIARVRALTDHGRGDEVFRRGVAQAGLVLDNGLVRASLAGRGVELVPRTVDTRSPTVLAVTPRRRIASEVVTHREADVVSVEARDSRDRPVIGLTLRRGIPGAFVWLAPGHSLRLEHPAALLRGTRLRRSTFAVGPPLLTSALADGTPAALVPSTPDTALAIIAGPAAGTDPVGTPAPGDGQRLLVGTLPVLRAPSGASIAKGDYLVVVRGRRERTRIVRNADAVRRRSALTVPFLLDDREHSGLAELVGFSRAYGLMPQRPAPGTPQPARATRASTASAVANRRSGS